MFLWKLRLTVAALILGLFVALFLATGDTADASRKLALYFQLSPNLTRVGLSLVLAAAFLASALVFGRVYCSILCPAGLVQEAFLRLGGLLRIRRLRFVPAAAPRVLLLLVAVAGIGGVTAIANFLDPIGLFGRLATIGGMWRTASPAILALFGIGALFLLIIPLVRGRWFCDRLCPVGALLGLFSAFGGRAMAIDAEKCVSCGQCEKVCPTRCADPKQKTIDPARCVVCLDCAAVCKFGAISRGERRRNRDRRNFLQHTATAAVGGMFIFSREFGRRLGMPLTENHMEIVPPGARSQARHHMRCISCQACVTACPVGIIRPMQPDLRPVLDYDRGFCQYNCIACSACCPAGVFDTIVPEEKQTIRTAKTTLLLDRCVVVTQGTSCGACAEVCPTHALVMRDQGEGKPTLPDFAAEYCIGCGGCYHVCPAEPRAFTLEGLAVHETSSGLRVVEPEQTPPAPDAKGESAAEVPDFPF